MNQLAQSTQTQLFEALLNSNQIANVITDPNQPDNPIVYTNKFFLELTGYESSEVLGRNCRFLQGAKTDKQTISLLRNAIEHKNQVTVTLQNYRKDGTTFWNRLHIEPVHVGDKLFFISSQHDITKEVEQRVLLDEKEKEITDQLLPIIPLNETTSILALVGKMNKERLQVLITKLSSYINKTSTLYLILDITGAIWEDEFFHQDLLIIQDVLRLMGSQLLVTGITPKTAIQIVTSSQGEKSFKTFSSVEQALVFLEEDSHFTDIKQK